MKSRQHRAFETLLARREQRGVALRDQQTAERAAQAAAAAELAHGEARARDALDAVNRYTARLGALAAGTDAFTLGDYASYRRYRDTRLDEQALADAHCARLRTALQQATGQLAATTRRIARNDAQIEVVRARLARLTRIAEAAAEDLQDEEIEEGVLARRLAARESHA
jgi:type III secretion system HrpB7-like protein